MALLSKSLSLPAMIVALVAQSVAADPAAIKPLALAPLTYVITNDDKAFPYSNVVSFFQPSSTSVPDLTLQNYVNMPGQGLAGGYFATSRLSTAAGTSCLYVADSGTGDISAVDIQSQQATGPFFGSPTDSGNASGIGLALNAQYLYASFTTSNTIATFIVMPGCQLSFLSDVSASGLHGGNVNGMAIHGNMMVVAYGDGSIESFDISGGAPVPNGDAQDATGFIAHYYTPTGVDITKDGRYAIFGDASQDATVEVSDISAGKLTRTIAYSASKAVSASEVRLTEDESMLFISNSQGGTITAAFFDKQTGKVSPGCSSPTLNGFYQKFYTHGFLETPWFFLGTVIPEGVSAKGGLAYVAEFGATRSYIGIIHVISNGRTCTMTESSVSPAIDYNAGAGGLLTLTAYPPRSF
jgi:WD40 repeat protein